MFFKEFEHIITQVSDIEGERNKELALGHVDDLFNSFTTVESYSISRLKNLHDYLLDLSIDFPLSKDDVLFEKRENSSINARIHSQLKVIERILNLPDDVPAVIEKDDLILLNAYGYATFHKKGRLWGYRNTMTRISRQCRFYLFKDKYYDVDLRNAHPTILLSYAQLNQIEVPVLEEYVTNREEFLEKIMMKSNISREAAKTYILTALNLETDAILPKELKTIHADILPIRNHIYDTHFNQTISDLGEFCLTRKGFNEKTLGKRKISVQSHYCQTEESKSLEILREVCLQKGQLSREAKLSKEVDNLSFIPFFDGAYIMFPYLSNKEQVQEILNDTNRFIYPQVFELKQIEPKWEFITESDLRHYENINKLLGSLTRGGLEKLLDFLGVPPFSLSDDKLDDILSRNTSKKDIKELKNGLCFEFNDFVKQSTQKFYREVRRALLIYYQHNRVAELHKFLQQIDSDSTQFTKITDYDSDISDTDDEE